MEPIGWIVSILVGGISAGFAERLAASGVGGLNIAMGIVGAIATNAVLEAAGLQSGGWFGYLLGGFVGACILVVATRALGRQLGG